MTNRVASRLLLEIAALYTDAHERIEGPFEINQLHPDTLVRVCQTIYNTVQVLKNNNQPRESIEAFVIGVNLIINPPGAVVAVAEAEAGGAGEAGNPEA